MFQSAEEVLAFLKDEEVVFVDLRFTDMPGVQQHFNLPAKAVDEDFSRTASSSTGPRSAASRASPSPTCS